MLFDSGGHHLFGLPGGNLFAFYPLKSFVKPYLCFSYCFPLINIEIMIVFGIISCMLVSRSVHFQLTCFSCQFFLPQIPRRIVAEVIT